MLSAVPTAASGAADWSDTGAEQRRGGLIHALLNSAGLVCFLGSLFARRADQRPMGIGLSTLGLRLTTFSAWLGGELVYRQGTGVNRTAFNRASRLRTHDAPTSWRRKTGAAEIEVDGTKIPLVLLKKGRSIWR